MLSQISSAREKARSTSGAAQPLSTMNAGPRAIAAAIPAECARRLSGSFCRRSIAALRLADRIGMCGALHRLLAGAAEIFDGLVDVVAVAIVMRQLT